MLTPRDQISPNYRYLALALETLPRRPIDVLDLGCGEGHLIHYLREHGYHVSGFDLERRAGKLAEHFGSDPDIRVTDDPTRIPFPAASFDALVANQVFEHVTDLDAVLSECRRVLRAGGTLIATFPLKSVPVEMHLFVPFVHWLPDAWRERYLRMWYTVTRRHTRGTPAEMAAIKARYLREATAYRSKRTCDRLLARHFEKIRWDTARYVATKAPWAQIWPIPALVTYAINASVIASVRTTAEPTT